jgi:predicted dehydrogenase
MEKKDYGNSRRAFLKNLTAFAGISAIPGFVPWLNILNASPAGKPAASDKVRIGIIGVGSRGSKLLQHLQLVPGVEIAAVCDNYRPHYQRAIELAGKQAKAFHDYKKLLELKELDGVVVATPIYNHKPITIDSLQAGKHVFCEKAMANTVADSMDMVKAHRATGKNLQIGHQRMFDVTYLEALKKIHDGDFGPITHIRANWYLNASWRKPDVPPALEKKLNWRMYQEQCLGLMSELACHITQVANWFTGEIPEYVVGSGSINYYKDGRTNYDNVNVVYSYPNGVNFTFNSILTNWHYGLEEQIMGPKATMELEKGRFYLQNPPPAEGMKKLITDIEKSVFETIPIGGASWIVNTGNTMKGDMIVDQYPLPNATTAELEAFVNSIRENKQIPGVLEEAYYGTITSILGHQAMEEKKAVFLTDDMKI